MGRACIYEKGFGVCTCTMKQTPGQACTSLFTRDEDLGRCGRWEDDASWVGRMTMTERWDGRQREDGSGTVMVAARRRLRAAWASRVHMFG